MDSLNREEVLARAAVEEWLETTLPLSAARTNVHMVHDTPTYHTYGEFDWEYWCFLMDRALEYAATDLNPDATTFRERSAGLTFYDMGSVLQFWAHFQAQP